MCNTTCENYYPAKYYHEGLVDTWNLPWIDYKFKLVNIQYDDNDEKPDIHICIIIMGCVSKILF